MNLHETTKPQLPQVYSYVTTDGAADMSVTRGDVEVLHVNWEKLDWDYFSDYQAEDFLADWRTLGQIAAPELRRLERQSYLRQFSDRMSYVRAERRQDKERERVVRERELAQARRLLREAGELV